MYIYTMGFPVLMLAAVIDASVLVQVRYLNGQPSLLLMILVSWALLNELRDALPWAILGGIFADLLSVAPLGASSLGYVLVMLALASLFGRVGRRNLLFPPLAALLATVIYQSVILVMLILTGWTMPLPGVALRWMLPSLVFNLIGVVIVFRVMGSIVEFFRPPVAPL